MFSRKTKQKLFSLTLALSIIGGQTYCLAPTYAREFSKSGQIFQQVKDGVLTVFTSCSHGSGFLVDKSGLVITNSHVVQDGAEHLRVKFGPKEIVEAKVIVNDREHDIAILRVNLKNIQSIEPLEVFDPGEEKLVLVGEKIIAIGTPFEKETLDKTMTEGIVGKFDKDMIICDASINHGNSGGPLLNFDGKVVGINTRGYGQIANTNGAVPITLALKHLKEAKVKIAKTDPPSPDLLPDIPEIAYPISIFLREHPEYFKDRKQKKYNIDSSYFEISVLTPPQTYAQSIKIQDALLKNRKKRAKKKGFAVSDDEYNYKNSKYYNYKTPVVTILVKPKEKLTTGCVIAQSSGLLAATTLTVFTAGIAAPFMAAPFMYNKKEIKKDFLKMSLVDDEGNLVAESLESGRRPHNFIDCIMTDYYYKEIKDKSYIGHYTFEAKAFDTDKKLKLLINIEGNDKDKTIKFPDKIKTLILDDFAPYWDYVANIEKEKNKKTGIAANSQKEVSGIIE